MKKYFSALAVILVITLISCTEEKKADIKFAESEFDFGTIKQGDKVNHTFSFENKGNDDLIITNAMGSCGCTVPEYPKEAVKPNAKADIKVSFNSAGKEGDQTKSVTIYSNAKDSIVVLKIKAHIEK